MIKMKWRDMKNFGTKFCVCVGGWKGRKEAENTTSVARNMIPPLLNFSMNIFRKSLPIQNCSLRDVIRALSLRTAPPCFLYFKGYYFNTQSSSSLFLEKHTVSYQITRYALILPAFFLSVFQLVSTFFSNNNSNRNGFQFLLLYKWVFSAVKGS